MRNEGTISESIKSNSFSALDVCFFFTIVNNCNDRHCFHAVEQWPSRYGSYARTGTIEIF